MTDVSQPDPGAPAVPGLAQGAALNLAQGAVPGLVQRMRVRTRELHASAEQSGIIAAILAGQATRLDYAIYLRNILPAYRALEQALERHRNHPVIGPIVQPSLFRAASIQADLERLAGAGWPDALPQVPAAQRYAARVAWAAGGDGGMLIAHAYTRYLGDLNGGRILRRHLVRLFGADFLAVSFLEFPAIADIRVFAAMFRAALDSAAGQFADPDRVVQEAAVAFELNIALSQEVADLRNAPQRSGRPVP